MYMESITNISPIDGRYQHKTKDLAIFFSEFAYIRYRLLVEIRYFIFLSNLGLFDITNHEKDLMLNIYANFNYKEAEKVKHLESVCNHDVKSIEYYIKEKISDTTLNPLKEFIHFGLTSQDVNSMGNMIRLKESISTVIIPHIEEILDILKCYGSQWANVTMLSRTHGQPATPTLLGKELVVFYERIIIQVNLLLNIDYSSKFGGCIGNMNAHCLAYPEINWLYAMDEFVAKFNLTRNQYTTQIDHYDNYAQIFDIIRRINTILIDLNTDIWEYISMDYFKQTIVASEVGSSTMPHKINPIDFENSEGNLLLGNALLNFLSNKLPISRLQRDLTDSTITRNIGSSLAYSLIGYKSIIKGLKKLTLNMDKIKKDLEDNWIIIVEGIQTILRSYQIPNAYELLKDLSRNHDSTSSYDCIKKINTFIDGLDVSEEVKTKLRNVTPFNYVGRVPSI